MSFSSTILPFCFVLAFSTGCNDATTKTVAESPDNGFISIFNGKSLDQWEGDTTYWRVEDGNLVGEVTPATLLSRNSFIIWRGGTVKNFELKLEYRVSAEGNSGINYRSEEVEGVPFALRGYQADLDGALLYTGRNYEERGRTTLASRGSQVVLTHSRKQQSILTCKEQCMDKGGDNRIIGQC